MVPEKRNNRKKIILHLPRNPLQANVSVTISKLKLQKLILGESTFFSIFLKRRRWVCRNMNRILMGIKDIFQKKCMSNTRYIKCPHGQKLLEGFLGGLLLSTIKVTKIILSLRGCITTALTAPEIRLFCQKVFL